MSYPLPIHGIDNPIQAVAYELPDRIPQDRTVLLVDEAARRVGFDVRIRYTRQDTRLVSIVEETRIIQNKNRSE